MIFTERRGGGGSGAKNIILEHPTKAETETMDCVSSDLKKMVCTSNKSNLHSDPTKWEIRYSWRPVCMLNFGYLFNIKQLVF